MDREYEATIETEGQLHFPKEVQERYGLTKGAHVKIKEEGKHLVIDPVEFEDISDLEGWMSPSNAVEGLLRERALDKIREDKGERHQIAMRAIDDAVGMLGTDGSLVRMLMEERRAEKERDDHAFGAR